jgi:hypothetical protein
MAGRWFSPGIPVSSINKTDRHVITYTCIVESGVKRHYLNPKPILPIDNIIFTLTINIDIVSSATMFWLSSDARFYYGFIALLYTELQVTRVIKGNN